VSKNYRSGLLDSSAATRLALPETVSVAMEEITADMREGLLALAVGTGLRGDAAVDGSRRGRGVRPEGQARPGPYRGATRAGERLGDPGRAPGAGAPAEGAHRGRLGRAGGAVLRAVQPDRDPGADGDAADARRHLDRRYRVGLEPVGQRAECAATSMSKSAISRRFVAATETALAELLAAPLGGLDLVALLVDGVHFGEHVCVVALGIGIDGTKHPLALVEGSTENTTTVTELLVGLRDRGLDTSRPIFVGIDGAKALRAAVTRVFDHPVIGRCQLHKVRNVADRLPDHLAATVAKRMRAAYHAESALVAEAQLEVLASELDRTHPGAAASCAKAWPRR
jgi:putative transposase